MPLETDCAQVPTTRASRKVHTLCHDVINVGGLLKGSAARMVGWESGGLVVEEFGGQVFGGFVAGLGG